MVSASLTDLGFHGLSLRTICLEFSLELGQPPKPQASKVIFTTPSLSEQFCPAFNLEPLSKIRPLDGA